MNEQKQQRVVLGIAIAAAGVLAFLDQMSAPRDVLMEMCIVILGGLLVLTFCLWVRASCRRSE